MASLLTNSLQFLTDSLLTVAAPLDPTLDLWKVPWLAKPEGIFSLDNLKIDWKVKWEQKTLFK